jgi:uncharacterized MnhB-related membrane protein
VNYLIPYPYTVQIGALLIIAAYALITLRKKINWGQYGACLFFTGVFGVFEIHGLENTGNVASWYFAEGASLWGTVYKNIYIDDILFVPACFSIFFVFMYLIRNIKDWLPKQSYTFLVATYLIVEGAIYDVSGPGIRSLIIVYTFMPLTLFLIYCAVKRPDVNITHAFVTFLFVSIFSSIWEIFNVYGQYWIYDTNCDLMGDKGWFFNKKLHVGIFFQYAWSGFIVVYSSYIVYGGKYANSSK